MRNSTLQLAALSLVALSLTACSKQKTVEAKNESAAAVSAKVAEAGTLHFTPGRWEMTTKIDKLDFSDAPPEAKQMIQGMIGKTHVTTSCLTKEEADKPTPKFFGEKSDECTYDNFSLGGGKVDATMHCKQGAGIQTVNMHGTYTPDSYQMTVDAKGAGHEGMMTNMTMSMNARHVGECTGTEDSKDGA